MMESKTAALRLQAEAHWCLLATWATKRKAWNRLLPSAFRERKEAGRGKEEGPGEGGGKSENSPTDNLNFGFSASKATREYKKPSSVWYLVTAGLANQYACQ